jgi:peptidoglycan L-alanyl-D-glutamate endopeptidase CwlK
MTERDSDRLKGVHPTLIKILAQVLDDMSLAGTPMFVVEGVRTVARQQELWHQGRDIHGKVIGKVVTYKDGIVHRSNHQPHADGFGHAVDCAFVSVKPFDPHLPWDFYGELLEAQGVTWGGRWSMQDLPHAEWPDQPEPKKA